MADDEQKAQKLVVLSIFADEAAADKAVEGLKAWDKSFDYIELTAIGVLAIDDKGKLKEHKMGTHSTTKGVGIGLLLAVIFPPSLLAGAVGGGIIGRLHHKNLGMSAEEQTRIVGELQGGKAAVAVLSNTVDAPVVSAQLVQLGGTAETVAVTSEAIADVDAAAAETSKPA